MAERTTPIRASLLAAAALLLVAPATAGAEPTQAERAGLLYGASIGPARLDIACDGCADLAPIPDALSLTAEAGAMLTPRIALVVEHWAIRWDGRDNHWFGDSEDHRIRESLTTAGGQIWLGRRLWLRGAIGVARHHADVSFQQVEGDRLPASYKGETTSPEPTRIGGKSPAAVGAIGYEVIYTPTCAINFALRAGASRRADGGLQTHSLAFNVGATWF